MRIIRFIFPFLFVRNWYSGVWELSKTRCVLFIGMLVLLLLGAVIAYMLQSPVVYTVS